MHGRKRKPEKNIELIPTITMMRTDTRQDFPSGEMADGKIEVEPGISGRWGITPNLMLNATINPDFSQVEADVAQLEVNTRFVLRYPEKRPFFLESADFSLTPIEAVFTRTVSNPYWGAKVSGKIGKNAVGVFVTRDSVNNLVLPANQGSGSVSLEDDTLGGVFRYRRDVGKGSTLGLLYTGRTGDDYFNHVAGLDGYFRLSRSNTLTVQYLNSRTDYPDAMAAAYGQEPGTFNGNALSTRFDHRSRNWICMFSYEGYSPGFRSDFGYAPASISGNLMFGLILLSGAKKTTGSTGWVSWSGSGTPPTARTT
jgi:hypothetical protein